jgi:hypothetical protein
MTRIGETNRALMSQKPVTYKISIATGATLRMKMGQKHIGPQVVYFQSKLHHYHS